MVDISGAAGAAVAAVGRAFGPTPANLAKATDQIQEGLGTLLQMGKDKANVVVNLTNTEASVERIHTLAKNNAELIFWLLAAVNAWQNTLIFVGGVVIGLASAGAGQKLGVVDKSVQLLKTKEAITNYNYLSGTLFFVLAPWLNSLQSGIIAGNYLGNPPPKDDQGFLAGFLKA